MSSKPTPRTSSNDTDSPQEDSSETDSLEVLDRYLETCLDRVTEAGYVGEPSRLREWLPGGLPEDHQSLLLVEMIKLDMSMAAEAEEMRSIEEYVDALSPPLSRQSVTLDLVIEEQHLSRSMGRSDERPISERFPHLAALGITRDQADLAAGVASTSEGLDGLAPGDQLDEFFIIARVGKGSFASVFLARQETMQRLVALKVSAGRGGESETLAKLDHPNIVRVFDQRSEVTLPDRPHQRLHLLYMQYIPGGSLADVVTFVRVQRQLGRSQTLSGQSLLDCVDEQLLQSAQQVPEVSELRRWLSSMTWCGTVAWIGAQLAEALDHAHAQSILHRDVKPANVLLSAEGVPKLADFNVSFSSSGDLSGSGSSLGGSLAYMSPEHLRAIGTDETTAANTVGRPADFYSLAVLLWELWQGRRPFQFNDETPSPSEILRRQLDSRNNEFRPAEPSEEVGDQVLEAALRRGMSIEPSERFQSGRQFAAQLQIALHPELAELFDPPAASRRRWLLDRSVYVLAAAIILIPNVIAGVFNFFYNDQQIIDVHAMRVPTLEQNFNRLAFVVNVIAFPAGILLLIWYTSPLARAMRSLRSGDSVQPSDIDAALVLGLRAASIGGAIWILAGLIYATTLRFFTPVLDNTEAAHFFMSLLICGGVAAVYPFFGMTWLVSTVYYPRFQREQLQDAKFSTRRHYALRWCRRLLFAAALIPLIGLMLLLSRDVTAKGTMAVAVLASVAGLVAAFSAYERIDRDWRKLSTVIQGHDSEKSFL